MGSGAAVKVDQLTPAEEQLLEWFKKRPMQKVSAEELRDDAESIWGRSLLDGPRVARSLWERGLLERNNGTRAPYWYVSSADHKKVAAEIYEYMKSKNCDGIQLNGRDKNILVISRIK